MMSPVSIVRPVDRDTATDLRDRWLFPALGAAGLVVSVAFSLLTRPITGQGLVDTLALIGLTLGWLSL
jgi:hypothetical protein